MAILGLCCFTLHCCVWASHCRGFSCCRAQALGAQALVVVTLELCCTPACGIFPPPGIEPMSPVLGGRFSTAGPPRKPSKCHLKRRQRSSSKGRKCLSMFLSFLLFWLDVYIYWGFPGGSDSKESAHNVGDPGSNPGLGRSPGERNSNPLQYSCLGNPMDREAWLATVHGVIKIQVTESWTQLSN